MPLEKFVYHSVELHSIFTSHTTQVRATALNNLSKSLQLWDDFLVTFPMCVRAVRH